jgi:Family of unknown function (DUF6400)
MALVTYIIVVYRRFSAGSLLRPIDSAVGNAVASKSSADLAFSYDLTLDEARRRAAVLEAIGDDWDPIQVLAEEEMAYEMLYSGLDAEQQRIYDELASAGVLPDRTVRDVAD